MLLKSVGAHNHEPSSIHHRQFILNREKRKATETLVEPPAKIIKQEIVSALECMSQNMTRVDMAGVRRSCTLENGLAARNRVWFHLCFILFCGSKSPSLLSFTLERFDRGFDISSCRSCWSAQVFPEMSLVPRPNCRLHCVWPDSHRDLNILTAPNNANRFNRSLAHSHGLPLSLVYGLSNVQENYWFI